MAAARTRTKAKAKTAPAPEVEEEDLELEEVEEEEVAPKTTKAKKVAPGQEEVTFGASDLAALLSEDRDKPVTARDVRTLARKLARDGKGRVTREIIPGNRARYNWSGPNDPEVQALIQAFNDGELEADKKEKLDALKARKDAERAAKQEAGEKPTTKKAKVTKKKTAPVVEVDEDDEELDLDDED